MTLQTGEHDLEQNVNSVQTTKLRVDTRFMTLLIVPDAKLQTNQIADNVCVNEGSAIHPHWGSHYASMPGYLKTIIIIITSSFST